MSSRECNLMKYDINARPRNQTKCVFDDLVNEFRPKAMEADAFVFGTPVHYAAAGGNIASFLDRFFYSESVGNRGAAIRLKPASAIAVARRGGTTAALDQMIKYLTIAEMPVVSSSYWNMVHGAQAEEVQQDKEGIYTIIPSIIHAPTVYTSSTLSG